MKKKAYLFIGLGFFALLDLYSSAWASGWNTSFSDYYPPSWAGSGRGSSSSSLVISLDLDPQNIINSSFRVAVREGRLKDAQKFLERGAEIDSRSGSGGTALMYASRNCSKKMVGFLLQQGANVNAVDEEGRTPLIFAARESCSNVVASLVRARGIKLEMRDQTKKTALEYAQESDLLEVGGRSEQIIDLILNAKKRS
jgi:ankyrin repeat protein